MEAAVMKLNAAQMPLILITAARLRVIQRCNTYTYKPGAKGQRAYRRLLQRLGI